jgi:hypothetical protein
MGGWLRVVMGAAVFTCGGCSWMMLSTGTPGSQAAATAPADQATQPAAALAGATTAASVRDLKVEMESTLVLAPADTVERLHLVLPAWVSTEVFADAPTAEQKERHPDGGVLDGPAVTKLLEAIKADRQARTFDTNRATLRQGEFTTLTTTGWNVHLTAVSSTDRRYVVVTPYRHSAKDATDSKVQSAGVSGPPHMESTEVSLMTAIPIGSTLVIAGAYMPGDYPAVDAAVGNLGPKRGTFLLLLRPKLVP